MGTPFTDIYDLMLIQTEDPFIYHKTKGSKIALFQYLNQFLMAAIPEFYQPSSIIRKITDITKASGMAEDFQGVDTYTLLSDPVDEAIFEVWIDSKLTTNYTYDNGTKLLTILDPVVPETKIIVAWYYAGSFNAELNFQEMSILSDLMIWKWSLKEKNNLADIRRILKDTDYQLWDEAKTLNAKITFSDVAREKAQKAIKAYSWLQFTDYKNQEKGLSSFLER